MRFRSIAFVTVLSACVTPPPAPPPALPDRAATLQEITAMLGRSAAAWNRGDLDGFMSDYLPGNETTYIGRVGLVRGPAAIKARYAPLFAPGGVRDSLYFEGVEVDVLGPDVINTIAWYMLMRKDSVTARGPTSLVMKKTASGWKILHDHSS